MESCYICQDEAVTRCYTCGRLVCARHGKENCVRCDTAVMPGDPPTRHVTAVPLAAQGNPNPWWRPQEAEDFAPPACYQCGGLARAICQHCGEYFCRDHAGTGRLCAACGRSARIGLIVFLIAFGGMLALILVGGWVIR